MAVSRRVDGRPDLGASGSRADTKRVRLEVYGDSQLVINHLTSANFCQTPNLRPYYDSIMVMQKEFKGVRYHWHDRKNSLRIFGH